MELSSASESAFEQAKKYGEDLVKLYAIEKAKRVNLQISNQKLQAVFSTTPDGLAVLDVNLNIEEANPAFWALVEKDAPETSIPIAEVLPFVALLESLHQNSPIQVEIDVPLTQTLWRSLLINAVPLAAGEKHGWLLSAHDLTERKRLENLKSEFINIAAHELRTPLAAVLGFSQVLKETLPDQEGLSAHLIDTILNSSNRLKFIIDELIEFADIRYQTEAPQTSGTFDIAETIRTVLDAAHRTADEKGITLSTDFAAGSISMSGNQNILQEALRHIIENAIIFNKPNGLVTVRLVDDEDTVVIKIEDSGIGIAQKEIGKIFDKFYQVEEHLTRSVGGLGLGLAIAARGIHLHDGEISVQSTLNRGSCFTIVLPKIAPATGTLDPESGLRDAYEQTLEYGKDLAKAVAAERKQSLQLREYQRLGRLLQEAFENEVSPDTLKTLVNELTALGA